MADTAKRRKLQVDVARISIGTRVSVPLDYFDTADFKYSDTLLNKENIQRLYGTCSIVFSTESQKCMVKWDVDGNSTQESIANLNIENAEAHPENNADHGESAEAIYFLYHSGKKIFKAKRVFSDMLHGHKVKDGHWKFEVRTVLNLDAWPDYNEDNSTKGCFISWPLKDASPLHNKKSSSSKKTKPKSGEKIQNKKQTTPSAKKKPAKRQKGRRSKKAIDGPTDPEEMT